MTGQPLFFEQVVALDKARHSRWRLKPVRGFDFAAKANAVPVTLPELAKACIEYPLVFLDEGQGPFPVAVLGLRPQQNLFVGAGGRWDARYVPAYTRMYPFILARTGESERENFTVCLDAAYAGFNEQDGEPLFLDDGTESEFLNGALAFLKEFQLQRDRTAGTGKALADAGLLTPMQANVELRTGESLSLAGFLTLNEEKFSTLTVSDKAALVESGALELVYLHRASLHGFDRLVERLAAREKSPRTEPGAKKSKAKQPSGEPVTAKKNQAG